MKPTPGFSCSVCAYVREICCAVPKFGLQGKLSPADTSQPKLQEHEQEWRVPTLQMNGLKMHFHAISKGRIKSWDRFSIVIKLSFIHWLHQACTNFKLEYDLNLLLCSQAKCSDHTCGKRRQRNHAQPVAQLGELLTYDTEAQRPRRHWYVRLSYTDQIWNKAARVPPRCCYTAKTRDRIPVSLLPAACSDPAGSSCKMDVLRPCGPARGAALARAAPLAGSQAKI